MQLSGSAISIISNRSKIGQIRFHSFDSSFFFGFPVKSHGTLSVFVFVFCGRPSFYIASLSTVKIKAAIWKKLFWYLPQKKTFDGSEMLTQTELLP